MRKGHDFIFIFVLLIGKRKKIYLYPKLCTPAVPTSTNNDTTSNNSHLISNHPPNNLIPTCIRNSLTIIWMNSTKECWLWIVRDLIPGSCKAI